MAKISNMIEEFLKDLIEESRDGNIEIQRNHIAKDFDCSPSQINYVLRTRFSLKEGYRIISYRGGGGYVRIEKMVLDREHLVNELLKEIGDEISKGKAFSILDFLEEYKVCSERESKMLQTILEDHTLSIPVEKKNRLRAQILKLAIGVLSEKEG